MRSSSFDEQYLASGSAVSVAEGAELTSCGRPIEDHELRIVEPETGAELPDGAIGEIWVSGSSVAAGYWQNTSETAAVFSELQSEEGTDRFLRTGDLGFLEAGELFVTGRIKDLIKLHGLSHYPQDIEQRVEATVSEVRPGCCVAFSFPIDGVEKLAIVAEVRKEVLAGDASAQASDLRTVIGAIRLALADYGLPVAAVVLVPARHVAKTTSGKLIRVEVRRSFIAGELERLASWEAELPVSVRNKAQEEVRDPNRDIDGLLVWLRGYCSDRFNADTAS